EALAHAARNAEVVRDFERSAFIRTGLLLASTNAEPRSSTEQNDQFERWPTWGPPAARIYAAQGLLHLPRQPNGADRGVLTAIDNLSRDPVTAVRYMIGWRLWLLYETALDVFWRISERFTQEESSHAVLEAFVPSVLVRLSGEHADRAVAMALQ